MLILTECINYILLLLFCIFSCTTFMGRSTDTTATPFILTSACFNTVEILLLYVLFVRPLRCAATILHTYVKRDKMPKNKAQCEPVINLLAFLH